VRAAVVTCAGVSFAMLCATSPLAASPPLVSAAAHSVAAVASDHATVKPVRWPQSICQRQSGHRFTTTAVGDRDNIVVEPVSRRVHPVLSAAAAYRHFHQMYGPTTPAQDRTTQIRYGLITNLYSGPVSANVIGYVPGLRRTRAWIVTNCVNASPPLDDSNPGNGTVIFAVADTTKVTSWTWVFFPATGRNRNPGETGPYRLVEHPKPSSTAFYSTPWRVAARRKDGKVLLRYTPRDCFTLDHVNFSGNKGRYEVSVILSSGPGKVCPKPSATSPYFEILPLEGPIRTFLHDPTGPRKYKPEDA
jgi:hypothetical protein